VTIVINPGSRVPAGAENTYERALATAQRWHEQMREAGFGHDVDLLEDDPDAVRDGRWTFMFVHRVTGAMVPLETHGLDPAAHPFVRMYWQGSSSANPALDDWSKPGFVQTFRKEA
jgi:hypothetical protein